MTNLKMTYNTKIVISHVSGKCMIKDGTDGMSRGQLREGVTAGESMLSFIPLNEDPLDRTPKLKAWIKSWAGDLAEFLVPDDWFKRGHNHRGSSLDSRGFWTPNIVKGTFIWTLPPGAAKATMEELQMACLKWQRVHSRNCLSKVAHARVAHATLQGFRLGHIHSSGNSTLLAQGNV
jgi:hypothetical protein